MAQPSRNLSFPSVKSLTITANAAACPRATPAADPPPGVGALLARASWNSLSETFAHVIGFPP